MGGMGEFFGSLVGTIGDHMSEQQKQEHDDLLHQADTRRQILQSAASDPNITDDAKAAIWDELINPPNAKGGKGGKGKKAGQSDPLIDLLGHVTGMKRHPALPAYTDDAEAPQAAPQAAAAPATALPRVQDAAIGEVPRPPGADQSAQPAQPATAQPTATQPGTLGQPPSPPHMFKTQADRMAEKDAQTQADFISEAKAYSNKRWLQYQDTMDAYKKSHNGEEPDDDTKQQMFEAAYPMGKVSKNHEAKDLVDGADGKKYRIMLNDKGEEVSRTAVAAKPTVREQAIQEKVKNFQAANPKLAGESDADYGKRAETSVRRQQYQSDALRVIGLGLGNQAKSAQIQRTMQLMKKDGPQNRQVATTLWNGAWRSARLRKTQNLEDMNTPIDSLVEDELQHLGSSTNEISSVLRGSMGATAGATRKPAGGVKTADDLAKKLGIANK